MASNLNVPMNGRIETINIHPSVYNNVTKTMQKVGERSGQAFSQAFDKKQKRSMALGRLTGDVKQFQKSMEAADARVLAFGASTAVFSTMRRAVVGLVASLVDVERAMADISVVMQGTDSQMKQLKASIFEVSKGTATSFSQVSTAVTELARQGLSAEESAKRAKDAMILVKLTGMDAEAAVSGLTAAINGYSSELVDSTRVVDTFAKLDQQLAVSSEDLIAGFNRSASIASATGVKFNELATAISAVQQITAVGGAKIGNGLKTIFTRLGDEGRLQQLRELGVEIDNTMGQMDKVMALADAMDRITDPGKENEIAKISSGMHQINIFTALMKDLNSGTSLYKENLASIEDVAGSAQEKMDELNLTMTAQVSRLKAIGVQISDSFGDKFLGPAISRVLNLTEVFGEMFASLTGGNNVVSKFIKGIGNILGGPGLIIGAKFLLGFFVKQTAFLLNAIKHTIQQKKETKEVQEAQVKITSELQRYPQLLDKVNDGEITIREAAELVHLEYQKRTTEIEKEIELTQQLAREVAKVTKESVGQQTYRHSSMAGSNAREVERVTGRDNSNMSGGHLGSMGGKAGQVDFNELARARSTGRDTKDIALMKSKINKTNQFINKENRAFEAKYAEINQTIKELARSSKSILSKNKSIDTITKQRAEIEAQILRETNKIKNLVGMDSRARSVLKSQTDKLNAVRARILQAESAKPMSISQADYDRKNAERTNLINSENAEIRKNARKKILTGGGTGLQGITAATERTSMAIAMSSSLISSFNEGNEKMQNFNQRVQEVTTSLFVLSMVARAMPVGGVAGAGKRLGSVASFVTGKGAGKAAAAGTKGIQGVGSVMGGALLQGSGAGALTAAGIAGVAVTVLGSAAVVAAIGALVYKMVTNTKGIEKEALAATNKRNDKLIKERDYNTRTRGEEEGYDFTDSKNKEINSQIKFNKASDKLLVDVIRMTDSAKDKKIEDFDPRAAYKAAVTDFVKNVDDLGILNAKKFGEEYERLYNSTQVLRGVDGHSTYYKTGEEEGSGVDGRLDKRGLLETHGATKGSKSETDLLKEAARNIAKEGVDLSSLYASLDTIAVAIDKKDQHLGSSPFTKIDENEKVETLTLSEIILEITDEIYGANVELGKFVADITVMRYGFKAFNLEFSEQISNLINSVSGVSDPMEALSTVLSQGSAMTSMALRSFNSSLGARDNSRAFEDFYLDNSSLTGKELFNKKVSVSDRRTNEDIDAIRKSSEGQAQQFLRDTDSEMLSQSQKEVSDAIEKFAEESSKLYDDQDTMNEQFLKIFPKTDEGYAVPDAYQKYINDNPIDKNNDDPSQNETPIEYSSRMAKGLSEFLDVPVELTESIAESYKPGGEGSKMLQDLVSTLVKAGEETSKIGNRAAARSLDPKDSRREIESLVDVLKYELEGKDFYGNISSSSKLTPFMKGLTEGGPSDDIPLREEKLSALDAAMGTLDKMKQDERDIEAARIKNRIENFDRLKGEADRLADVFKVLGLYTRESIEDIKEKSRNETDFQNETSKIVRQIADARGNGFDETRGLRNSLNKEYIEDGALMKMSSEVFVDTNKGAEESYNEAKEGLTLNTRIRASEAKNIGLDFIEGIADMLKDEDVQKTLGDERIGELNKSLQGQRENLMNNDLVTALDLKSLLEGSAVIQQEVSSALARDVSDSDGAVEATESLERATNIFIAALERMTGNVAVGESRPRNAEANAMKEAAENEIKISFEELKSEIDINFNPVVLNEAVTKFEDALENARDMMSGTAIESIQKTLAGQAEMIAELAERQKTNKILFDILLDIQADNSGKPPPAKSGYDYIPGSRTH